MKRFACAHCLLFICSHLLLNLLKLGLNPQNSNNTAVAKIKELLIEISGQLSFVIMLDLSVAFDIVNHFFLLETLQPGFQDSCFPGFPSILLATPYPFQLLIPILLLPLGIGLPWTKSSDLFSVYSSS